MVVALTACDPLVQNDSPIAIRGDGRTITVSNCWTSSADEVYVGYRANSQADWIVLIDASGPDIPDSLDLGNLPSSLVVKQRYADPLELGEGGLLTVSLSDSQAGQWTAANFVIPEGGLSEGLWLYPEKSDGSSESPTGNSRCP